MTRDDLRILCTALGFTAVVIKDTDADQQAKRAEAMAQLIESFCAVSVPDAMDNLAADSTLTDMVIDQFKAIVAKDGVAELPTDKAAAVKIYERLLQRQLQRANEKYLATASHTMIADRIADLLDAEVSHDQEAQNSVLQQQG